MCTSHAFVRPHPGISQVFYFWERRDFVLGRLDPANQRQRRCFRSSGLEVATGTVFHVFVTSFLKS
jgi:hypothetical protein